MRLGAVKSKSNKEGWRSVLPRILPNDPAKKREETARWSLVTLRAWPTEATSWQTTTACVEETGKLAICRFLRENEILRDPQGSVAPVGGSPDVSIDARPARPARPVLCVSAGMP